MARQHIIRHLPACLLAPLLPFAGISFAAKLEFNRDVRPILSDRCFSCHGPDRAARKSALRLDLESSAKADQGKGRFGIVPGDAARSEVFKRVSSDNRTLRMPPAYMGHDRLSDRDIETIRRWIEEGAEYQPHWSFLPPKRPSPPEVKDAGWMRNAIDRFILARLEREGLAPSPEADRARLLRRVTLDLTGLPPTPAEIDAFLRDSSANAYETRGGPAAGVAALCRADGDPVAGSGPLCRHQRLSIGRPARHVALARLGDRRL